MFLQKDELSKFDFISIKEFFLALFLLFLATIFSFVSFPMYFKKMLPVYSSFFNSHYFGIIIFFLSAFLNLYIIYHICCIRKQKQISNGLFLYLKPWGTNVLCLSIGIIMPLISLPIIFKFTPSTFYAMDLAKTKEGLIYLFICGLFAPIFEEVFYRGFIFPFFQSKLNSFWAIIITALIFGFSHFTNIGNAHILLSLFIFYGFILTLIRYFTNSLIPPMITHFVHNLTLMLGFFMASR